MDESKPSLATEFVEWAEARELALLREAVAALVDVMPYLQPHPNAPADRREAWAAQREDALEKAAAALDAAPSI